VRELILRSTSELPRVGERLRLFSWRVEGDCLNSPDRRRTRDLPREHERLLELLWSSLGSLALLRDDEGLLCQQGLGERGGLDEDDGGRSLPRLDDVDLLLCLERLRAPRERRKLTSSCLGDLLSVCERRLHEERRRLGESPSREGQVRDADSSRDALNERDLTRLRDLEGLPVRDCPLGEGR